MNFEKILSLGVEKNIINQTQKDELLDLYDENDNDSSKVSSVVKILYYIGGFIMLSAMTSLMSDTIQHSTYMAILVLGIIYEILFIGVGEYLWRKNEKLPAGILYFLYVAAFGLITMDIEKMIGFFPHFSDMYKYQNYWEMCRFPVIVLSVLTIMANGIIQKYRPSTTLALPVISCSYILYITFFNWFFEWQNISADSDLIFYDENMIFGIALLIVGFILDRRTKVDYSQWMYFIGSVTVYTFSLLMISNFIDIDWQIELIIFILSAIYILIGMMIKRKPFSIIGILGVIEYILYLEFSCIKESTLLLTSVVLITGLIILYAGVLYNKNLDKFENFIESKLPQRIKMYLPQNRI